jgi:TRAP-type mannitol/chloroaromatic compound transport system permease large subunit
MDNLNLFSDGAGYLMGKSGMPNRLLNLSQAALGWMPRGLAVVTLSTCAVFTTSISLFAAELLPGMSLYATAHLFLSHPVAGRCHHHHLLAGLFLYLTKGSAR